MVWIIAEKQKNEKIWYPEKFQTGGEIFYNYKEAQRIKKALKRMSNSFEYKVIRIS